MVTSALTTPGTLESADRTLEAHPTAHVIPETASEIWLSGIASPSTEGMEGELAVSVVDATATEGGVASLLCPDPHAASRSKAAVQQIVTLS
jgi:hypothetical protein